MGYDAERSARIAALQETARPVWEATGDKIEPPPTSVARLARMQSVRQRAQELAEQASAALAVCGLSARFEISAREDLCLIEVDLRDGDGFQALVSTFGDGWVGVLDPHQENLTATQWARYVVARAQGATAGEALKEVSSPLRKARWWRRSGS
ncbi:MULTISPECIES: hypothetical protein [Streptomyces]|uniref:Uncharacterized protein n=1 Tax=Streptomyces fimbriatus TaxID=68197 RepID=A0ABW0D2S3_STRFI